MTPHPIYYRLRKWEDRLPGASGTPDAELVVLGCRVLAIENDPDLLEEARAYLGLPSLRGKGLRKVTLPDEPGADIETAIYSKLQQLESDGRIDIISKQ